jgi:hypothetical protein
MARLPAILREETDVFVPSVEGIELALVVLAGRADQEVSKIVPGFGSREDEVAIELRDGVGVHLVVVELAAKLHGVAAQHFRKGVRGLPGVVRLDELIGRGPNRVGVEVDVLDALAFGVQRLNAIGSVGVHESLRGEADVGAANGLAEVGGIAHEAHMELVHGCGAQHPGGAERCELRAARGESVEAGDAGSALRNRIRIVEAEAVDKVIAGEQSPARVRVEARRSFVVAKSLV